MATSPDSNSHSNGSSSRDILPRLYRRGRMSQEYKSFYKKGASAKKEKNHLRSSTRGQNSGTSTALAASGLVQSLFIY